MLDSKWADFGCLKFALAIPSVLAFGLVSYITYIFQWVFIPAMYEVSSISQTYSLSVSDPRLIKLLY